MGIAKKLEEVLCEGHSRLRPARIVTARGVTIEADHARIVRHPETGTQILVMGIGSDESRRTIRRYQNIGIHNSSLTGRMRDFTAPGEYVPNPTNPGLIDMLRNIGLDFYWQDETGWSHQNSVGKYCAHRNYVAKRKFDKILTAFISNIKSIKWL